MPPRLQPTMLTEVPCSLASRSTTSGSSLFTCSVGPRLRPSAQPTTGYPSRRSQARSAWVETSDAISPGRTSTGCGSPRGARVSNGNPAASAPALIRVRAGSVAARTARRRGERGAGRAVNGPPRAWRMRTSCPAGASGTRLRSVDRRRQQAGREDLVDRPRPDVLAAGAGHPAVPGPAAPPVEGVAAQLGVAGGRLPVVLAECVAAAAQRGHRRGRRRTTPADPTGREADRQQHAAHQQADRFHAGAPSRSTAPDGNAEGNTRGVVRRCGPDGPDPTGLLRPR